MIVADGDRVEAVVSSVAELVRIQPASAPDRDPPDFGYSHSIVLGGLELMS